MVFIAVVVKTLLVVVVVKELPIVDLVAIFFCAAFTLKKSEQKYDS